MYRSHGLVREATSDDVKRRYAAECPDLTPEFTFAFPAFNVRSTELNAVLGRSQLRRLDANNEKRTSNLRLFLSLLDSELYFTDFAVDGSSNYALPLLLRQPNPGLRDRVEDLLRRLEVEFRRGTSGGGNQLRQPYLRKIFGDAFEQYPVAEHVHFYGYYIGNYPDLDTEKIRALCAHLNATPH
jgi:CDP-6-deoxy-D-xylo-4-hexulose-3-dehydrase